LFIAQKKLTSCSVSAGGFFMQLIEQLCFYSIDDNQFAGTQLSVASNKLTQVSKHFHSALRI